MEQIGNTLKRTVGKNITKFRKEAKIRQEELANRLGITTTTLSKIENGEGSVRLDLLEKIAEELQVRLADLMFEDEVLILSKNLLKKLEKSS